MAVVVLSPNYLSSPSTNFLFNQVYNHMVVRRKGSLYLFQLKPIGKQKIPDRRLKALVRLRKVHNEKEGLERLENHLKQFRDV